MHIKSSNHNIVLIAVAVFVMVGVIIYRSLAQNMDTTASKEIVVDNTDPTSKPDQVINSNYNDGSYVATGNYISPEGNETIDLTIELENGIIKNTELVQGARDKTSIFFQEKFASGYKELIIGKNIDEVKLDVVAGSSLTPIGFNEAIEKIKEQAQS